MSKEKLEFGEKEELSREEKNGGVRRGSWVVLEVADKYWWLPNVENKTEREDGFFGNGKDCCEGVVVFLEFGFKERVEKKAVDVFLNMRMTSEMTSVGVLMTLAIASAMLYLYLIKMGDVRCC